MKGNFLGLGEKTEGRTNLEGNPVPKARVWTSLEKDGSVHGTAETLASSQALGEQEAALRGAS